MEPTPFTGIGLGLRRPHMEAVARDPGLGVPFWETCPENLIGEGGRHHRWAMAVLERDAVLTHGLAISLGGFDTWDKDYLLELGKFLTRTGTPWHSEHLCFTSVDGSCLHDLLPLPFTREAARHTIRRARDLQARLPVPLILENITYYAPLGRGEMDEAQFIAEVLEGADAGWLLDINNVYVNALNFGFDPREWLASMPLHRVVQMHIAGHRKIGDLTVDTHGAPVIGPVAELMRWTLQRIGRRVPVLLERDSHIPELAELLAEREALQAVYDEALGPVHA
ncbi:DUF692 domain-containing protein [Geothrix sp. 21YS21S-2]|uniref:DUF692 domain-containing protein n=1 Tax=Geothrix sp. 21YS21S-2 TaxID=3068893 RepID=UPI0027BA6433|nr:DUF692 domain-containing protein [Geothrix sp. 21YS21S-2]